jgi:hypothetical protein
MTSPRTHPLGTGARVRNRWRRRAPLPTLTEQAVAATLHPRTGTIAVATIKPPGGAHARSDPPRLPAA